MSIIRRAARRRRYCTMINLNLIAPILIRELNSDGRLGIRGSDVIPQHDLHEIGIRGRIINTDKLIEDALKTGLVPLSLLGNLREAEENTCYFVGESANYTNRRQIASLFNALGESHDFNVRREIIKEEPYYFHKNYAIFDKDFRPLYMAMARVENSEWKVTGLVIMVDTSLLLKVSPMSYFCKRTLLPKFANLGYDIQFTNLENFKYFYEIGTPVSLQEIETRPYEVVINTINKIYA